MSISDHLIAKLALNLPKPTVYYWVRNEKYLYIGCTENLTKRLARHDIIGVWDRFIEETDYILYIEFDDIDIALSHEAMEIDKYEPKFNGPQWQKELERKPQISAKKIMWYGKVKELRNKKLSTFKGIKMEKLRKKAGLKNKSISNFRGLRRRQRKKS